MNEKSGQDSAPSQRNCVLVTGGSRGIGRAITTHLVAEGWKVAFTYRAAEAEAQALSDSLNASVGDGTVVARAFQFDLRDRARPKELVETIEETFGPLEALVNNAGIQHGQLLAMTSDDAWDETIDTNLGGTFRVCRAVVPRMVRRRRGAIVNLSSLGAIRGVAGQTAYAASKAGVLALSRSLAREMGKRNLRVNAVIPGYVETDMTRGLPEKAVAALRSQEVLRAGTSDSAIADAVAFLLSERASSITGQSLTVDSGASI